MNDNLALNFKKILQLKKEIYDQGIKFKKMWGKGDIYLDLINNIEQNINSNILEDEKYAHASVGQGRYSNVPWIAIYNPEITEDTKDGYYVVILIHPEGKGVYLSLNQGWIKIKNKHTRNSNNAKREALKLSKTLSNYFSDGDYNKGAFAYSENDDEKNYGKYAIGYTYGSILYKYYKIDDLEQYDFYKEIKKIIELFDDLSVHVSKEQYDNLINDKNPLLKERSKLKLKNIKKVDPPTSTSYVKKEHLSKKYINNEEMDNLNKLNKSIGNRGEHLAVNYFNQLIDKEVDENKKDKFRSLINNEMSQNHGYGYDLVAFDPNNLSEPHEKYIEVKATTSKKIDEPFYLSVNELIAMFKYKHEYLIMRFYDINSNEPKMYIIDPYENYSQFDNPLDLLEKVFEHESIQFKIFHKY